MRMCNFLPQNGPFLLYKNFLVNHHYYFHLPIGSFHCTKFKKILTADPELWGCAIFGPKMVHLPQTKFFLESYYYHSHLSISPFHCAKFLKNSSSRSRVMRMCNFWTQNGPFPQIWIFSENLSINLVFLIHAYLHAKIKVRYKFICEILTIKEYWNLIGWEPFLAINWELDFFQACSFRRMLMNHKNAHFSQIPDKTNDVIFLESPKTLFWGQFWSFLVIFASWGFFPKNLAVTHNFILAPNTMPSSRKN